MPVLLYNLEGSPHCSFIRCLAKEIGVQLSIKEINCAKGEHRSAEFIKKNPFHKVPTIDDGGLIVYESNAIAYYLLRNPILGTYLAARCLKRTKPSADEVKECEEKVLKCLEHLLGESKFAAGDKITLADLCLIGHVAVYVELPCVNRAKYPKLAAYYDRVKGALPYFNEVFGPAITQAKKLWDMVH
ncbi:hypothetical protein MRX96_049031 [Rhipicephalus microplus]